MHTGEELKHVIAVTDNSARRGYAETVQAEVVELLVGACAADENRPHGAVIHAILDVEVVHAGGEAMDAI
jgi:hypothetical protein